MTEPPQIRERAIREDETWDFDGTRRHHIRLGLRLTPAERLRWLEETVAEMRQLLGLARQGREIGDAGVANATQPRLRKGR